MIGNLSIWELIVILILVVVIFGGRKLPELGRGLGQGLANFRQAVREPDPPATPQAAAASSPDQARPAETPASGAADQAGPPPSGDGI